MLVVLSHSQVALVDVFHALVSLEVFSLCLQEDLAPFRLLYLQLATLVLFELFLVPWLLNLRFMDLELLFALLLLNR